MTRLRHWLSALRPRTLFLAVATALCGSGMAYSTQQFSTAVFVLTIAIAVVLQLLSNMANDLGDYQQGTDTTGQRVGPTRAVQSGAISPKQMKIGIYIVIVIAMFVGLGLVCVALQFMNPTYILFFILLGAASILAAVKYTSGKNPYGYKGLGDIFSFLFFGPVAVVGTYFLHVHTLDFRPWLPAIGLGLLTVAVLNVNNMRDRVNDEQSGKKTIAVRLGYHGAKLYHATLVSTAFACFFIYGLVYSNQWYQIVYLFVFIFHFKIVSNIYNTDVDKELDPYLKYTSMATFFLSLCFVICINL